MTITKIFLLIIIGLISISVSAKDYYISSSTGNDQNKGTSAENAWASFEKLNDIFFEPGDRILLKAGDTIRSAIELSAIRGSDTKPITFTKYGEGPNPLLDGNGADKAIFLRNPSYVEIKKLSVTNPEGRYGILVEAENSGALKDLVISELEVFDVYNESFNTTSPPKTIGGIVFRAESGDQPSWFDGILIEDSRIHDLGSCGISIGSDYKVNKRIDDGENTYPTLNVIIRNNVIHDIVRDGAIIRQCYGAIMEHNEVYRTGLVAVSNGMWFYDSDSCFIQHNIGHHCKAAFDKDGAPFSIDNMCTNSVIQFNYSYENEGPGYMLFGHNENGGSGCVIQHNISYNDHTNSVSAGIGSISLVSTVTNAEVRDNVVIAGPATGSVLGHRNWDGYPLDVKYTNNLFIGNGIAFLDKNVLPAGTFRDNFFINIADLPEKLMEENNKVSNYFGKLQEMIKRFDQVNGHNVAKFMD